MRIVTLSAAILGLVLPVGGRQAPADQPPIPPVTAAQRMFEAGQYAQALQAIAEARKAETAGAHEAFLAAQVHLKQTQNARAREEFTRLTHEEDRMFQLVGMSGQAFVDAQLDRALELATEATTVLVERDAAAAAEAGRVPPAAPATPPVPADPAVRLHDFHAYYLLGLVKMRRDDWAGAAGALERASQLNPAFAYAHYYAGTAYSRVKRPDRVAVHFEQFLKLAPTAPERTAVMAILRTIRGG